MMARFPLPLNIRGLSPLEIRSMRRDVALWELTSDFAYQCERFGVAFSVPIGFLTDFATIPRAVWAVLSPDDPVILMPSVIHDYLYKIRGATPWGLNLSRHDCDLVLMEAMEYCGAQYFTRKAVYHAVRAAGASHW